MLWNIEQDIYESIPKQQETPAHVPVSLYTSNQGEKSGDVVIVTDCGKDDKQLNDMISRFRGVLKHKSRVVNIAKYP
ncbi:MAG TPA: hypothetical protein VFD00_06715 [Thermoclostridium sp.]|nr:hypothetical protein [Thermoclostridium sp.]